MVATVETVEQVKEIAGEKYKYGFVTDIESETSRISVTVLVPSLGSALWIQVENQRASAIFLGDHCT